MTRALASVSLALAAAVAQPPVHRTTPPTEPRQPCPDAGCRQHIGWGPDRDHDRIADSAEQALADRYAPVVWHAPDEPNFPTSVDSFLPHTRLGFFDSACGIDSMLADAPLSQPALLEPTVVPPCDAGADAANAAHAAGTRSENKARTFYLADVARRHQVGDTASTGWTTYYHAYRNRRGGVTVQYWRFYSFNTGLTYALADARLEVGHHGGDWESVQVVLNSALRPVAARFVGHTSIVERNWPDVHREGDRLVVASEPGRHSSQADLDLDTARAVRQETWSGGTVRWPSGRTSSAGALVNLGEKTAPFEPFLAYSGLWGSPGSCLPGLGCINSGYWGPAYNETGMRDDGFITAWCTGMADSMRARNGVAECYPAAVSP
ncbi:MAG TPA: hypothetical protein VFS33_01130 [Gemmatimonadales bacterium]|nr:hypothetical protein [Gemmatimonadales bacterium]